MATLTVRNLDPKSLEALRALSASQGRSMEAQARMILTEAVRPPATWVEQGLGSRIRARFEGLDVPDAARRDDLARAAQLGE